MAEVKNRTPLAEGEQDMSELLRVRREKLRELQESGNDPYQITKYPVDNDSANIKANFEQLEGKPVSCLLYTSPIPRDTERSRVPAGA